MLGTSNGNDVNCRQAADWLESAIQSDQQLDLARQARDLIYHRWRTANWYSEPWAPILNEALYCCDLTVKAARDQLDPVLINDLLQEAATSCRLAGPRCNPRVDLGEQRRVAQELEGRKRRAKQRLEAGLTTSIR